MDGDEHIAMVGVARHLASKIAQGTKVENGEALRLTLQYLCDAYSIDLDGASSEVAHVHSFPKVYMAGLQSLKTPVTAAPAVVLEGVNSGVSGAAFQKFLARLKTTTKFFDGVSEGTPEYEERIQRAYVKFEARLAEKREHLRPQSDNEHRESHAGINASSVDKHNADADAQQPEREEQAEKLKEEGNALLKSQDYTGALRLYSEAIALNGKRAPYYTNRAAALIHLGRYSEAISDCERAISIDTKFLRARERLASAYRKLCMFDLEHETLLAAGRLHPNESRLKAEIAASAERKRLGRDDASNSHEHSTNRSMSNTSAAAMRGLDGSANLGGGATPTGFPGMPDLSALLGGNGGDMSAMMSIVNDLAAHPSVSRMMQDSDGAGRNPQAMFQSMVQNPELLQAMTQAFGRMAQPGNGQ
jgi:tetratricopeptide (TPR) repeat protein